MSTEKHIISSCVIANNIVLKNGKQFFRSDAETMQPFLLSLYAFIKSDYPKFYKMDNLSKLGWLAAEVLLKNESIISGFTPEAMGIVLMNANSSLDVDVKYFDTAKSIASPGLFVYTLPNIVTGEICIRNNIKGENIFFVADNFDAAFVEEYINYLFDNDVVKLCITGWVDVVNENYKAVLFLIATKAGNDVLLFNEENMNRIFKSV